MAIPTAWNYASAHTDVNYRPAVHEVRFLAVPVRARQFQTVSEKMVENEIQYLSWEKFKRMTPSIIRLELSRLERLALSMQEQTDCYNLLVKARFELTTFVTRLEQIDRETLEEECEPHLRRAILALSMCNRLLEGEAGDTVSYIGDRLHHVYNRMVLLY